MSFSEIAATMHFCWYFEVFVIIFHFHDSFMACVCVRVMNMKRNVMIFELKWAFRLVLIVPGGYYGHGAPVVSAGYGGYGVSKVVSPYGGYGVAAAPVGWYFPSEYRLNFFFSFFVISFSFSENSNS